MPSRKTRGEIRSEGKRPSPDLQNLPLTESTQKARTPSPEGVSVKVPTKYRKGFGARIFHGVQLLSHSNAEEGGRLFTECSFFLIPMRRRGEDFSRSEASFSKWKISKVTEPLKFNC